MKYFFPGLLALACLSCNNDNKTSTTKESVETNKLAETSGDVKVGGLYSLKNKDGLYYVDKVLAIDTFAIHLRTYANQFQQEPVELNSDTLTIAIGHSPWALNGFLQDQPKLIKVEEVKESELEGYRIYLDAMRGE